MRPVNLIPPDERRGQDAPGRTGPLPYLVIGMLVAALAGVTALVLIGNQVSDRKSEVAKLEREDTVAQARAERLSAYSQFRTLREQRLRTVSELANSRFDWERVMRELSLVLPRDVWLVGLTATASPQATLEGGSGGESGLRGSARGPALQLAGCATGQEAVASFVTALKDIDGVTRVGVQSSELGDQKEGAGVATSEEGESGAVLTSDDCRTRNFIAKFEIVVAFDAAPVPIIGPTGEAAPVSPTEKSEAAASETAAEGSSGAKGG